MGTAPVVNIADILDTQRMNEGVWVQFKDTSFFIRVTYYGKAQMTALFEKAKRLEFDTRSLDVKEQLDTNKFRKEYAKMAIREWKGLTIDVLRQLVVISNTASIPADYEIPCTDENREMLIASSVEFDQWLQRIVTSVETFNQKRQEEEVKN